MKKASRILWAVILLPGLLAAQEPSLEQVLATLRDAHTPAEKVDALLPRLVALEKAPMASPDSQRIALEIFQQASFAYARNYHFRQGLLVYQGFLALKERFAASDKKNAVSGLTAENEQRLSALNNELVRKKNEAGQLALDIETWTGRNGKFSRNYSLVVILATAVMALFFLRLNLQTVRSRRALRENRDALLQGQRLATLGRFREGVASWMKSSTARLPEKVAAMGGREGLPAETSALLAEAIARTESARQKLESLSG